MPAVSGDAEPAFALRGVVEGFYGTYYTFPQRDDLIQFLGRHGFNYYVYGPKNDRQHRMRWFDPYPATILDDFARTIENATDAGITFCFALSFGVPIRYGSVHDFGVVSRKLTAFIERGCQSFAVFFDDLTNAFTGEENLRSFRSAAEAQATFCNRLFEWLRERVPDGSLLVCPTDYCGRPPFSRYVVELGHSLHAGIDIFYTGPDVCPRAITVRDARAFAEAIGRPPVIWDNYPVNDGRMRRQMHVGPLRGRDPHLGSTVRGLMANPMNQEEASKIALVTVADYLRDPEHYHPSASWKAALREIGGEEFAEPLARFAENSLRSPLQSESAPRMDRLVGALVSSLERGERLENNPAARALSRYFDTVDQAGYRLKNRMRNLALRQDLLPWIEALEERVWMGRAALMVLNAIEQRADISSPERFLDGLVADVDGDSHVIGGSQLRELASFVQDRARMSRGDDAAVSAAGKA
jgi:hyaluronoglucosaminidase